MAGVSEQDLAVARVYAAAMIELAEAQGEVDVLFNELLDFMARTHADPEFEAFVSNPTIATEARKQTLEKLFRGQYSDLFVDSLQVLNRRGRLGLLPGVTEAYRLAREQLQGRIRVDVRSATPLTEELRDKLTDVITKQTGKEPDLIETVDKSLIGGLVVRIGDEKFDASVATRLKRLGGALRDRASREIHSGRRHWEGAAV